MFSNYLDQVAEEINDTLQESGQVVISELSKTFSFAADFLLEVHVVHYLGLGYVYLIKELCTVISNIFLIIIILIIVYFINIYTTHALTFYMLASAVSYNYPLR